MMEGGRTMAVETYKSEYRKVTIKTTDGSTLTGTVNIGIKDRVSDLFTRSESPFVVLTEVETRDGSGKVLFLNKRHIVWVEPND
jgi:hypothetical protein